MAKLITVIETDIRDLIASLEAEIGKLLQHDDPSVVSAAAAAKSHVVALTNAVDAAPAAAPAAAAPAAAPDAAKTA